MRISDWSSDVCSSDLRKRIWWAALCWPAIVPWRAASVGNGIAMHETGKAIGVCRSQVNWTETSHPGTFGQSLNTYTVSIPVISSRLQHWSDGIHRRGDVIRTITLFHLLMKEAKP